MPDADTETDRPPSALFVPSLRGGGAERVMVGLSIALAERGIPVDLVLVRAEGEYMSQVSEGVRVVSLSSHRTALSLVGLTGYLRRERPSVLLSTLFQANAVALISKILAPGRARVIVRIENTLSEAIKEGTIKERLTLELLKRLLPAADRIVAISQGVADDLCDIIPSASHKIVTIYSPVVWPDHAARASAPVKHSWFNSEQLPVVLSVA